MPEYEANVLPFDAESSEAFEDSSDVWNRFLKESACKSARDRGSEQVELRDVIMAWRMCKRSDFDPVVVDDEYVAAGYLVRLANGEEEEEWDF